MARVIAAEDVPEARKLLKLTLSLGGDERRTVFAGIKEAYKPEELVGKLVVMAANLAPRKMKFGLSEGMILASGAAARTSLCWVSTRVLSPVNGSINRLRSGVTGSHDGKKPARQNSPPFLNGLPGLLIEKLAEWPAPYSARREPFESSLDGPADFTMAFEHIERLQQEYTEKLVVVDNHRAELARFRGLTGTVKTINMSG